MNGIRNGIVATTLGIAALDGSTPTNHDARSAEPVIKEALMDGLPHKNRLSRLFGNGDGASDTNRDDM